MYLDNETVMEQCNYRVRVVNDYDPLLPEGDGYAPQYVMPWSWKQRTDIAVNMDSGMQSWLYDVVEHFRNNLHDSELSFNTLERYARIFHDTNARVFDTTGYSQGDYADIIVWPSVEWLETVGLDNSYNPADIDVSDLSSYLWGDVITLELQERTTWTSHNGDTMTTYETIDAIGGIYVNQGQGDDYVKDIARDLIISNIA